MNKVHKINGFIYVTSNEKPKENQYGIGYAVGFKGVGAGHYLFFHDGTNRGKINSACEYSSTVILTNDNALIDVQKLTPQEVEYLNNVDECDVEKLQFNPVFDEDDLSYDGMTAYYSYKIIIPKEEPLKHTGRVIPTEEVLANRCSAYEFIDFDKQETLKEAADKYSFIAFSGRQDLYDGFIAGAKWQAEQDKNKYSEEEVQVKLYECLGHFAHKHNIVINGNEIDQWFNQNKKK